MCAVKLRNPALRSVSQSAITMDQWIIQIKFVGHACLPLNEIRAAQFEVALPDSDVNKMPCCRLAPDVNRKASRFAK